MLQSRVSKEGKKLDWSDICEVGVGKNNYIAGFKSLYFHQKDSEKHNLDNLPCSSGKLLEFL